MFYAWQTGVMKNLERDLIRILSPDGVSTNEVICKQHSQDEGVERKNYLVDLVVWPKSTEELSAVAAVCSEMKIPMIPFGTGTGLESGVCAVYVRPKYLSYFFFYIHYHVY